MSGSPTTTERISFPVAGMTCTSCVNRITRAVRRLDGVRGVRVDLGAETVTVRREPLRAPDAALAAAITAAGYAPDLASTVVIADDVDRGFLARMLGR